LVRSGLQFVGSDNAGHFGYRRSLVLVYQDTPAAYQLGRRVARALGLPARDVAYATRTQTIANVIVVLGADYRA
jgi:hypothetical protein